MNEPRRDWSVDIQEAGRCGKVFYREPAGSLAGYWEFGGGDTVASIHVGDAATWRQQHGWAVARRSEILRRIAGEVIRLKAPSCRADIDEQGGWINLRQGAATPVPPPIVRSPSLQVSAVKGRIVFLAALALLAGSLGVWGVRNQPSAKVMRRLYRGQLGPEEPRSIREILSLAPLSEDAYLDAAFVRAGPGLAPLALPEGAGHLMVFTSAPGLAGTLVVARVDPQGKTVWKTDTGIDRFKWSQILPDSRIVAFVGPRPPVPNKVPEPILVTIDTQSGSPSTTTLWQ